MPTTPRLRSAHVPTWTYALVIVAVPSGSTVAAREVGWFTTSGRGRTSVGAAVAAGSTAEPGSGAGQGSEAGDRVVPAAGEVHDDVTGWMTVQQVLDAFPVTRAGLYERFGSPALRTWLGEQTAK